MPSENLNQASPSKRRRDARKKSSSKKKIYVQKTKDTASEQSGISSDRHVKTHIRSAAPSVRSDIVSEGLSTMSIDLSSDLSFGQSFNLSDVVPGKKMLSPALEGSPGESIGSSYPYSEFLERVTLAAADNSPDNSSGPELGENVMKSPFLASPPIQKYFKLGSEQVQTDGHGVFNQRQHVEYVDPNRFIKARYFLNNMMISIVLFCGMLIYKLFNPVKQDKESNIKSIFLMAGILAFANILLLILLYLNANYLIIVITVVLLPALLYFVIYGVLLRYKYIHNLDYYDILLYGVDFLVKSILKFKGF